MKKLFSSKYSANAVNAAMLLLRLCLGTLMLVGHGFQKITHFSDTAQHIPNLLGVGSTINASLIIFAEFFCSLLLIVGLFTRFSLLTLLFCMGYIFTIVFQFAIVKKGDNGYEFDNAFVYFAIYLGLFFTGSGKYSLDAKLFSKR